MNNAIVRNTAHGLGRIRFYNAGVHLDSRPENLVMSIGNHIASNTFHDLSRNGIFAFRNQGGNVIEYNHIHDFLKETIDGAGIHFASTLDDVGALQRAFTGCTAVVHCAGINRDTAQASYQRIHVEGTVVE